MFGNDRPKVFSLHGQEAPSRRRAGRAGPVRRAVEPGKLAWRVGLRRDGECWTYRKKCRLILLLSKTLEDSPHRHESWRGSTAYLGRALAVSRHASCI